MKGKDVTQYVQQALECGFSHIDTASCELPLYKTPTSKPVDVTSLQITKPKVLWYCLPHEPVYKDDNTKKLSELLSERVVLPAQNSTLLPNYLVMTSGSHSPLA